MIGDRDGHRSFESESREAVRAAVRTGTVRRRPVRAPDARPNSRQPRSRRVRGRGVDHGERAGRPFADGDDRARECADHPAGRQLARMPRCHRRPREWRQKPVLGKPVAPGSRPCPDRPADDHAAVAIHTGTIMWTCAASCRFAFGWRRRARRGRCARRSGRCRRGRTPRGSRRCSWRRAGGARDGQVTRVCAACGSAAEHAQDPTCAECDRVTAPLSVSLTA